MLKTSMLSIACFVLVGCSGATNSGVASENGDADRAASAVASIAEPVASSDASKPAAISFAGTWGSDAAECAMPQDMQGAPMILTEAGYDQHEAHCSFTKVSSNSEAKWTIEGTCSVEGDEQTMAWEVSVKGDALSITEGGYTKTLKRCS